MCFVGFVSSFQVTELMKDVVWSAAVTTAFANVGQELKLGVKVADCPIQERYYNEQNEESSGIKLRPQTTRPSNEKQDWPVNFY